MNCEAFERWLDDGCPGVDEAAARGHAEGCPRCAAALRVATELHLGLEGYAPPAPPAFTDRVMARVAAVEESRAAVPLETSPLGWWLRAATDPATVLALLLAGFVAWRGDALWGIMTPAVLRITQAAAGFRVPSPALLELPGVPLALALAAAPFLLWVSWRVYVAAERACLAAVGGTRAR